MSGVAASPPGFFVDAALGSDSNPGTIDRPWRTLAKAGAVALRRGEGLYLRCGRLWRERLTLGTSQLVDGSVIAGYGDECPQRLAVVSGADDFSGGWTREDEVWSRRLPAHTPKITQLFVDGKPLQTAQWPDPAPGSSRMALLAAAKTAGATPKRNPELRMNEVAELAGMDLVGAMIQLRTQAWIIETRKILGVNGSTLQLDNATNWDLKAGQGYVLQDKRWMLNRPGEFFHDEAAQRLYVITPESGTQADLNMALVEGSVRDIAIAVGQRSGIVVRQLAALAARDTGLLVVDAPGAEVSGVDASANQLIGIQLKNTTRAGAVTTGGSIADSVLTGNGQYGIEAAEVNQPVILRNTISRTGIGAHRQANVVASVAAGPGARVEDNVVAGSGYAGIMFSSLGGSMVAGNKVFDHCSRLADCAGIYSWTGRAKRKPGQTSTVHRNTVMGGEPQTEGMAPASSDVVAGIYIDDFSDGVTVVDNLIVNPSVGVFVHNASRVSVRNNRIWLARRAGLWASMDQTDGDFMTGNVFENNQFVPMVGVQVVNGSLPKFSVAQAVWFWHVTAGTAALAPARNAFRNNAYVQLQGPVASHAWVHGPGAPGLVDALQWQRLNPDEKAPQRPARFTPLLATLGAEQIIDSGLDAGLVHWPSWHNALSTGFSVKALSNRAGCVGGCVEFTAGGAGDLLASQAFRLKAGAPYVYRWAAVMPATAGASLGAPYISRDGTPWDSMANAAGFETFTTRSASAGERLEYEAFFVAKASDPARVNVQLETPGVGVAVDTVSVREVLGYTSAATGDWVSVVSAPAGATRLIGCAELGWPAGCTVIGLDGKPVVLPLALPAGTERLLMRADSRFRR